MGEEEPCCSLTQRAQGERTVLVRYALQRSYGHHTFGCVRMVTIPIQRLQRPNAKRELTLAAVCW